MILDDFSYVERSPLTGCLDADARTLLEANGKGKTARHVREVAETNLLIAAQYGLNPEKCRAAALLHDISAVIAPADMLAWMQSRGLPLCEAERKHPFLLHQRLSRAIAADYFGISDDEVLSPIECHTTLKANASPYDMALFIADKLAWDQEGVPPFDKAVRTALDRSLREACLTYMDYMVESGRLLFPHVEWTAAYRWLKGIK